MKVPKPILWAVFVAVVLVNAVIIVRDLNPKTFDYCAAANLRTCKVSTAGEWTLVTSGNSAYLLLMKDGKVLQVQQVQ